MTDWIKTLDDAQRKHIEDQKRRAAEHPFQVVLGVTITQIANALILHRLGKRWGLPLRRIHWWVLLQLFGRDLGYPYNLVWQARPADAKDAFRREATDRLVAEILKDRDVQRAKRGDQPRPRAEAP